MTSKRFFRSVACCLTLFTIASGLCLNAVAQQPRADYATLVIEVVGFTDTAGNAMMCLLNNEDAYKATDLRKDRKDFQQFVKAVQDVRIQRNGNANTATFKIDNLKPGQYAAFIVHDRNQNGKMDSNLVGFPLEPLAFSNDIRPQLEADMTSANTHAALARESRCRLRTPVRKSPLARREVRRHSLTLRESATIMSGAWKPHVH